MALGVLFAFIILWSADRGINLSGGSKHTYLGYDYPRVWDIAVDDVTMSIEDSLRYKIDSDEGVVNWSNMLPEGGGFVRLGPSHRLFSISMIHQLRCLDITRRAVNYAAHMNYTEDPVLRHCMNYLRQMILCRANPWIENLLTPSGVDWTGERKCKDWKAVFEHMEDNYRNSQGILPNHKY